MAKVANCHVTPSFHNKNGLPTMRHFNFIVSRLAIAGLVLVAAPHAAAPQPAPLAKAFPESITSITPEAMATIIRDAGYKADVYEFGNPTKHKAVATAMEGFKVRVYFYSCNDKNECGSINFETTFTKNPKFTAAWVNKWNAEKRYTKLYIDPSDESLCFDFDIYVYGGVTSETIKDAVTLYDSALGDLAKSMP
jgi:hypothetical protein